MPFRTSPGTHGPELMREALHQRAAARSGTSVLPPAGLARTLIALTGELDGSRTLAVKVPDKGRAVQEVIRMLDSDAIVPESLAIREPTLDDVFLQLTGHRVGTGPDEPASRPTGASQGSAP